MQNNGKKESQRPKIRGTQDRDQDVSIEKKQCRGTGDSSGSSWHDCCRSSGSDWRWRDPFGLVNSEVIARLLDAVKAQIAQTQALIDSQQKRLQDLSACHDELINLRQVQSETQEENNFNNQLTEEE